MIAHAGQEEYTTFAEICGEFGTSQRADEGIGPYKTLENSCCAANFVCKANLPQIF